MTGASRIGGGRTWAPAVVVVAGLAAVLIVLEVTERSVRTDAALLATPSSAVPQEPSSPADAGGVPSTSDPALTGRVTDGQRSASQSSPGSSGGPSPQLQGPATNESSVSERALLEAEERARREAEERARLEAEERARLEAEERARREAEERARREAEERARQDAQRQLEAAAHEYAARVTPDVARAAANQDVQAEATSQYYAESSRCWNDDSLDYMQKLEQCVSRASAAYDAFMNDPGSYRQERYEHWYPQYYEAYYWDFIRYNTRR